MCIVSLDGVNYTSVATLAFNNFTTIPSGSTLTIQAPTPGPTYSAGTAIDLSGDTITNLKPMTNVFLTV